MYLEAPTKNLPFYHVKMQNRDGTSKAKRTWGGSLCCGGDPQHETLGEKGRVKARAKNRTLKRQDGRT